VTGGNSPTRTCPACARREGGVIAADCPICSGAGILHLGASALVHHSPQVVALAAEYHLEASARIALAGDPSAHGVHTARAALSEAVIDLVSSGVLALRQHVTSGYPQRPPMPTMNAAAMVPLYATGDAARLSAPPVVFEADERPMGYGGIPGFSAAGYLAYLSRASDPLDALGPSTNARASEVSRRRFEVTVLARAVREASRESRS